MLSGEESGELGEDLRCRDAEEQQGSRGTHHLTSEWLEWRIGE